MKVKFWLCQRNGFFFSFDSETGKRESLTVQEHHARAVSAGPAAINFDLVNPVAVDVNGEAGSGTCNFSDNAPTAVDETIVEPDVNEAADVVVARRKHQGIAVNRQSNLPPKIAGLI